MKKTEKMCRNFVMNKQTIPRSAAQMRHIITFSCFAAAIVLYAVGGASGAIAFFVAGLLAEIVFWIRLFRSEESE
jgi:hypothetical protein